jgi:hypothetical protein
LVSRNLVATARPALVRCAKDPKSFFELQSQQSQATTEKAQAYWQHVSEIATETRSHLVASSEKLVGEYVRGTQTVIDSLAENAPTGSEAMTAFWSKGFGAVWEAGNAWQAQTKTVAQEAADVIDKAAKPVAKV